MEHYVKMIKYHEKNRVSTNDRLKYWTEHFEKSKFELDIENYVRSQNDIEREWQ